MKQTSDFIAYADEHGYPIYWFPIPCSGSMVVDAGNGPSIAMDNSGTMTHCEEQAHAGHECGHCETGTFYTRTSPYAVVEQQECRADRWYIKHAIPKRKLFQLLRKGYTVEEIAEAFNTTEDYIMKAYYFYKEEA